MGAKTRRHGFLLFGLATCAALSVAHGQAAPPSTDMTLTATVTGLRSDRGYVLMSIYDGPAHWPQNTGYLYHCRAPIHNGQASCTFQPVESGHAYGYRVLARRERERSLRHELPRHAAGGVRLLERRASGAVGPGLRSVPLHEGRRRVQRSDDGAVLNQPYGAVARGTRTVPSPSASRYTKPLKPIARACG